MESTNYSQEIERLGPTYVKPTIARLGIQIRMLNDNKWRIPTDISNMITLEIHERSLRRYLNRLVGTVLEVKTFRHEKYGRMLPHYRCYEHMQLQGHETEALDEQLILNAPEVSKLFETTTKDTIDSHANNLYNEMEKLKTIDPYGNESYEKWWKWAEMAQEKGKIVSSSLKKIGFKGGYPYFWFKILSKENPEKWFKSWSIFESESLEKGKIVGNWYNWIGELILESHKQVAATRCSAIKSFQSTNSIGSQYETICAKLLADNNWSVTITGKTNDQGVDIVASLEGIMCCIQCKNHKRQITNKAVQEVRAGMSHYGGTHAVVVSSSGFTPSARSLAKSNNVLLLNEYELANLKSIIREE